MQPSQFPRYKHDLSNLTTLRVDHPEKNSSSIPRKWSVSDKDQDSSRFEVRCHSLHSIFGYWDSLGDKVILPWQAFDRPVRKPLTILYRQTGVPDQPANQRFSKSGWLCHHFLRPTNFRRGRRQDCSTKYCDHLTVPPASHRPLATETPCHDHCRTRPDRPAVRKPNKTLCLDVKACEGSNHYLRSRSLLSNYPRQRTPGVLHLAKKRYHLLHNEVSIPCPMCHPQHSTT